MIRLHSGGGEGWTTEVRAARNFSKHDEADGRLGGASVCARGYARRRGRACARIREKVPSITRERATPTRPWKIPNVRLDPPPPPQHTTTWHLPLSRLWSPVPS